MVKRRRKVKMPRLALLDSTRIGALLSAIDQLGELLGTMRQAVPALVELSSVSRELLAITSKMHQADQAARVEAQEEAARRSQRAKKANETRKQRRGVDEISEQLEPVVAPPGLAQKVEGQNYEV